MTQHPDNIAESIQYIKEIWNKFAPDYPFEYHFVDQEYEWMYDGDERISNILNIFSMLTILVACIGLFGLVSYSVEQRTKEIGIRKVLGASVSGIVRLLTKEFTRLVLLANILSWPVAWYVVHKWLEGFAYRVDVGLWIFLLSGVLTFGIAILTVSYQAIRAATSNPIEALKYE